MEEQKEIDHVREGFVHDMNGSLCHIKNCIEIVLDKSDHELKDTWLKQAYLHSQQALYLVQLLSDKSKQPRSCYEALEIWSQWKDFPKITITKDKYSDLILRSGLDTTKVVMIVSELAKNAYKADAKNIRIVFKEDAIHISNDGEMIPMEKMNNIFEKGFSTFGTTGLGLSICKDLANYAGVTLELEYTSPVTFKISKK